MPLPLHQIPDQAFMAAGALLIVLGLSFVYKGWQATVMGRCHYWSGFLPFTLISPWFIHIPPKENSLVKTREGLLCHMFIGPLLFLTAVFCLILGFDMVNLKGMGTEAANFILSAGNSSKPTSITYMPPMTYRFPIAARVSKQFNALLNRKFDEKPEDSLLPGGHQQPTNR